MHATARFPIAPFDLDRTLAMQRLGRSDPTSAETDDSLSKTFELDSGVHRATYRALPGELEITIEGPSATSLLEQLAPHFPPADRYTEFAPEHRLLAEMHHSRPGLRMLRVPWLWDTAASVILQQRVTYGEACRGFYALARAFGVKSELGLAFPTARKIARLLPAQVQTTGIDRQRAGTLVRFARAQAINDVLTIGASVPDLRARLPTIQGVGPWTTEMILGFGYGDPDALPLGDAGLPNTVCWLLAREPRGGDDRMLELLAPYAGHRGRVARMLAGAGVSAPY